MVDTEQVVEHLRTIEEESEEEKETGSEFLKRIYEITENNDSDDVNRVIADFVAQEEDMEEAVEKFENHLSKEMGELRNLADKIQEIGEAAEQARISIEKLETISDRNR